MSVKLKSYDYIIIGAGSAGCVLADRLSEDGNFEVLLIEAGGSDRHIFVQMPTALSYPMNMKRFNWFYESKPEPYLENRQMHCPRGKALGGSSSINGMVYVRGHARDFDEWQRLGAKGWSYQHCLGYFKRAESWMNGEDEYRGGTGPLATCNGNKMEKNPLYRTFIEAGVQAGYQETADYNGFQQEGFGPMHMTVDNGVRASTSRAYLSRAKKRKNLSILTSSLVKRILFKDKVALGVEAIIAGKTEKLFVKKEVILSAGSIGSPFILEHSGVGSNTILKQAGIRPIHNLPGVGENLQDHLEVYFQYKCNKPITLNSKLDLWNKGLIGAQWFFFKTGLGATNHFESCAFIRSNADVQWPDIQYHFLPAAMRYDGKVAFKGHGFQVHVGPNKPKSRGHVHIKSNDISQKPEILFNYLKDLTDREDWRRCVHLTREIINQPAFDDYRGDEIQPGATIQLDEEIDKWVRNNVESAYHPSCTCKMGDENDPMSVLDSKLAVRGLANIRVVDSSVFPSITNGNLNAPTIMVAEKAADIILNRSALPVTDAPVWTDPSWKTRQRSGNPLR